MGIKQTKNSDKKTETNTITKIKDKNKTEKKHKTVILKE